MPPGFSPILCLVVDRHACRGPVTAAVEAAAAGGIDWLQLRERNLEDTALLHQCQTWSAAAARGGRRAGRAPRILVNRRVDLALALEADGVHLGRGALLVEDARALLEAAAPASPPLLGVSIHHPDEALAAREAGADYLHLAPLFDPISKDPTAPPLGVAALGRASESGLPVLAQGGVTAARCRSIIEAGAAGAAVTGEILMAPDPQRAATALREALDDAGAARPQPASHRDWKTLSARV